MTTVKGLLKGLRYISQIFDPKEHEMQIGYPTDVKHVAHVGWDGPSVNSPSWMNEFRSAPLGTLNDVMADPTPLPARFPSNDLIHGVGLIHDSPSRESQDSPVPKPRRHSSTAADSPAASPGVPKRSRRNKTANTSSGDSAEGDGTPTKSPGRDPPVIPKVARKKKPKAGGGEGSTRPAKSRDKASLPDGGGGDGGNAENLSVVSSSSPLETAERA